MKKILLTIIAGGMIFSALPANAATVGGVAKSTLGVIGGTLYGAFIGGPFRGGYRKGGDWANSLSTELGGGTVAKAVGYPVGAIVGSWVGGIVGIAKGAVNGVYYGVNDALSARNFSVDGAGYGDFDPFDFNY